MISITRGMNLSFPKKREIAWCVVLLCFWISITVLFVGLRPEHVVMAMFLFCLFFFTAPTRRLLVALLPFLIFAISYDWMNLLPNYKVNPIDVIDVYNAEKTVFGVNYNGELLTPNEFFALHTDTFADFMAGIFYLCWVPLPVIFGLYLYFKNNTIPYLHFSIVFLLVNLIGFVIYYIHPAAPPWYIAQYGPVAIEGTPGSVAGLGKFDEMTGLGIFEVLYARNSNVFAAIPSLHSAYTLIAFVYSLRYKSALGWRIVLGIVTLGIWFTAVYTSHHYVIDVLSGIFTALLGIVFFEFVFMRIPGFRNFIQRYAAYIRIPKNYSNG